MDYTELKMFRVTVYTGYGSNRRVKHSYKIASTDLQHANIKVQQHLADNNLMDGVTDVIARDAGHVEFYV